MKINFAELGMPVFTGRERGRRAREQLRLDQHDLSNEVVEMNVPDDVYSITSSYFLGFLGKSVRLLGREGFRQKYLFVAPAHVEDKIDDWITRALREKNTVLRGVGND